MNRSIVRRFTKSCLLLALLAANTGIADESSQPVLTHYRCRHVSAQRMVARVEALLPQSDGQFVRVDQRHNEIVVSASKERQASIAKALRRADHPEPGIMLKWRLINVALDRKALDSLRGQWHDQWAVLSPNEVTRLVEKLRKSGRVRADMNIPMSLTRSGVEVTTSSWIEDDSKVAPEGTEFRALPRLSGNGALTLGVWAKQTVTIGENRSASGSTYPIRSTRCLHHETRIKSGETLVTDGLPSKSTVRHRIPVLCRLPLVGPSIFGGREEVTSSILMASPVVIPAH